MFEHSSKKAKVKQAFFYGWIILAVAIVAQIFTAPGQTVGVSEFKGIYAQNLEISDRSVALYYCFGTAIGSFALPLFGYLIDRVGSRITLMVVAFCFGTTCFLAGKVGNVAELMVAFTFLRMLGQGALSLVASTMVSLWFKRRLALAYSVMSVGTGLGMMFVPYMFKPLFTTFDMVFAFQLIAVGIFLLIPIGFFLVIDRPQKIGLGQDGEPLSELTSQEEQNDFT